MPEDEFFRKRPREKNPRKRPRRMKMPDGADTMPRFVQIDRRAASWLHREAQRNNVTVARMLSRLM